MIKTLFLTTNHISMHPVDTVDMCCDSSRWTLLKVVQSNGSTRAVFKLYTWVDLTPPQTKTTKKQGC